MVLEDLARSLVFDLHRHQAGLRIFADFAGLAFDEGHPLVRLHPGEEVLVSAEGPDIDVKDRGLRFRVLFQKIGGLLEGSQAADSRAIGEVVFITGPGALDKGDPLDLAAVGGARDFAGGWDRWLRQTVPS